MKSLETLAAEPLLDASYKGYPLTAPPCRTGALAQQGWNVLAGDLPLPLAVLDRAALAHNLAWMQDYARQRGVLLAPHGKTTMSPELFAQQLAAGAWGLTFASVWQARVGVAAGARRIIIANQVLQDADLDGLDALLAAVDGLRVWFLVDSAAQLALIEDWAARRGSARAFDVLLEMGMAGQRTGCRSAEEALALARRLAASRVARLGGIECYEGLAALSRLYALPPQLLYASCAPVVGDERLLASYLQKGRSENATSSASPLMASAKSTWRLKASVIAPSPMLYPAH